MYLDALTISSLVDEFMDELVGGRVQDVLAVDQTGYGFEIYSNRKRHYLYASADRQMPRIHLVGDKLRRGLYQPKQLGLLLRRYVEGALLTHVSQPLWERILFLDFEHPAEGESRLIIEPMERRANILLVRNDIIQDCVHRISAEENSFRQSLPNYTYQMPPPLQDRINPYEITLGDVETILNSEENEKLARYLPKKLLGFSPLMAREIVYRATGGLDTKLNELSPERLLETIQDFFEPLKRREWEAGVAGEEDVEAYAVYPLRHLPNWRRVDSTSEAMTEYYGAAIGDEAYEEAKKPVRAAIEEGKIRYGKKLESLESGLKDQSELEYLQYSGELILAYQYTLEKGQTELRAQYNPDEPDLLVKLDPSISPLENAQNYFDKYNRAKRALQNVPELVDETRAILNYVLQLESDLALASNWPDIDDVILALQKLQIEVRGKKIKRMGGGGKTAPLKLTKDGYIIWVGRNSRQNDDVTFRKSKGDDIWLHARDVPGAHVVIRNDGRRISEELIEAAAAIAAYYSPKRDEARADVIVTRVKYVKPIKNAGLGMVTYRNERTITVKPQNEEILNA
jgi:predicted ribosome quality control (RQC) complex YloA/Tae2 family protein